MTGNRCAGVALALANASKTASRGLKPTRRAMLVWMLLAVIGCANINPPLVTPGPSTAPAIAAVVPNPYFTPVADHEFVFNQVIDTLDNYFEIDAEERVRVQEGVVLEGRIETLPTIGATYLEPWRADSVGSFERLHATLQTIRRRASVRVIPTDQGYLIEIEVLKELEDLAQPESSPVTLVSPIHANELDREADDDASNGQSMLPAGVLGWIPLGRDAALEQRILGELVNRLNL